MNYYLVIIIFLSIVLIASLYYNYRFALLIIRMEDAIEVSLDSLDERYTSIQKVLDTPLFFDSPQVRQVIKDITESRDAVLYVANELTGIEYGKEEKD